MKMRKKVTKLGAIPTPCPIKLAQDAEIRKLAFEHKRKIEAANAKASKIKLKAALAESKRVARIMKGNISAEPMVASEKRTGHMVVDRNGFII